MGQDHVQAPKQQQRHQQSSSGPAQHTGKRANGAAPASATATAGARGYNTASKAVVTGTGLVAPAASTQKDDDYVFIRVPWEKVARVDTGRTETVQHHGSQSAGPITSAPVLLSVPVHLPVTAWPQCL